MSEDAVLAATKKSGNNNHEKRAWQQQKKPYVLIVRSIFVWTVLTRNISLCNK
jgi:hypothetical protein